MPGRKDPVKIAAAKIRDREAKKRRRREDPEVRASHIASSHRNRLKRVYGITPEQKDAALRRQRGLCGICREPLKQGQGGMSIDHCHKTGKFRGLLCMQCNVRLATVENADWVAEAQLYLSGVPLSQRTCN